jgi:putative two-component system response regulator
MKSHTVIGARILDGSRSGVVQMAHEIAMSHHEWWDGSGYPEGLSGEDIPLAARVCAVADVFDALISERPYKSAWPLQAAMSEIERHAGRHFDPSLAKLFIALVPELRADLTASWQADEKNGDDAAVEAYPARYASRVA